MKAIVKRILEAGVPIEDLHFLIGQFAAEQAWEEELEKIARSKN